jgi:hypothetical protein
MLHLREAVNRNSNEQNTTLVVLSCSYFRNNIVLVFHRILDLQRGWISIRPFFIFAEENDL